MIDEHDAELLELRRLEREADAEYARTHVDYLAARDRDDAAGRRRMHAWMRVDDRRLQLALEQYAAAGRQLPTRDELVDALRDVVAPYRVDEAMRRAGLTRHAGDDGFPCWCDDPHGNHSGA